MAAKYDIDTELLGEKIKKLQELADAFPQSAFEEPDVKKQVSDTHKKIHDLLQTTKMAEETFSSLLTATIDYLTKVKNRVEQQDITDAYSIGQGATSVRV